MHLMQYEYFINHCLLRCFGFENLYDLDYKKEKAIVEFFNNGFFNAPLGCLLATVAASALRT